MHRKLAASLTVAAAVAAAAHLRAWPTAGLSPRDNPEPARTISMLKSGTLDVPFQPVSGYLAGILRSMRVPIESQLAVFSRTSAQAQLISADNPRVIYFSDDVAVGWVRGSPQIEIAQADPNGGTAFYTVQQDGHGRPVLKTDDRCRSCHQSASTLGIAGLLMHSTVDSAGRNPELVATDHRTPLTARWGGWYVTGRSSGWKHQGNRIGQGWLVSLYDQFYDEGYLGKYSDIVALMVLEHQARMTNLLTLLGAETSHAAPPADVATTVNDVVDYILFNGEAPLPARIVGTSGFAEYFSNLGPRDGTGRSLRDFDLKTRLFKYPCSYMLYSSSFQQLPPAAKNAIYDRLIATLSDEGTATRDPRLTTDQRHAILEILGDTQPAFQARLRRARVPIGSSPSPAPSGPRLSSSGAVTPRG
jgi:hypothetical protein